jgi:hypothetical protein
MYRVEDIEKINENIDKIKNESFMEYKTNFEPTLEENSKVYKSLVNFIKDNKLIVYGGFAQNFLIKNKNPEDVFYKEINGAYFNWPDIADLEIYSPDPLNDLVKLCNYLYKLGFKYVEGKNGQNPDTFKIFVNFIGYLDISYMPSSIYNNIPVIVVDNIKLIHPHFMLCDTFRILTDPLTSYWRLDKSLKRFQKLISYYPIDMKNNNTELVLCNKDDCDMDMMRFIRHKIIHKSKLVVVGFYAFNYYVKKYSDDYLLNNYPYYELITTDLNNDKNKILKILKNKYKNAITYNKFCPFFDFTDERYEFYHNKKLILRLFGNNERCTVYRYSDKKMAYFGTVNLVLMYCLFMYQYSIINNNKKDMSIYMTLFGKLFETRINYLNKHKITVVDESPFQDFTFKCFGTPRDAKRAFFLSKKDKKHKNEQVTINYVPSGKSFKAPKAKFSNCSGNKII